MRALPLIARISAGFHYSEELDFASGRVLSFLGLNAKDIRISIF